MRKTLLLSALLSSFLLAEEASTNTQQAAANTQQTVQHVLVTPANEMNTDSSTYVCPHDMQESEIQKKQESYKQIRINVIGQGVAPSMTSSPAQAYALAKRAAIADAYRLLAEKIKGVRIEGSDKIKNMMVMRSEVRTFVDAVIAEAEIIETVFKDGLCEVEMELAIDPEQWKSILASR